MRPRRRWISFARENPGSMYSTSWNALIALWGRMEGGRRPVLEIDRGHKAGLLGQDVQNKLTDYKHKIDNTQSKMQHILLVLIQVTLHVSYIDLNANMRKRSVIIKWQHKLAIRGLICLYFCGGWNIDMQQWF